MFINRPTTIYITSKHPGTSDSSPWLPTCRTYKQVRLIIQLGSNTWCPALEGLKITLSPARTFSPIERSYSNRIKLIPSKSIYNNVTLYEGIIVNQDPSPPLQSKETRRKFFSIRAGNLLLTVRNLFEFICRSWITSPY